MTIKLCNSSCNLILWRLVTFRLWVPLVKLRLRESTHALTQCKDQIRVTLPQLRVSSLCSVIAQTTSRIYKYDVSPNNTLYAELFNGKNRTLKLIIFLGHLIGPRNNYYCGICDEH